MPHGKQRALLALLLLNANQSVASERLIDELWGERPPKTAPTILQGHVSQLRRLLEPDHKTDAPYEVLATEPTGYRLRIEPEQLDLHRFEALFAEARALGMGVPGQSAETLREALELWRGPPLADFAYDAFAQVAIGRLEELRLAAVEERIEADLALGRHAELAGELETLIAAHPLRERLRGQLMLALYRSDRQSEALAAYQEARRLLVDELGIDPSPALQQLERSILTHDPALSGDFSPPRVAEEAGPERSILLVPSSAIEHLLAVAEPLALSHHPHELIVARLLDTSAGVDRDHELVRTSAELHELRAALGQRGIAARVAAFTSRDLGSDLVRLASDQDVDLVLIDGSADLLASGFSPQLRAVLEEAPSDVAICVANGAAPAEGTVLVPFGGAEHDWAALELAAWLAGVRASPLRLLGATTDPSARRRDASRLLASASLAVQQLVGVAAEPLLVQPGAAGILAAADDAAILVVGLSDDWQREGLGTVRAELAVRARTTTLFVRRGLRPGGLAPNASLTRFTWSLSEASRG